LRPESLISAK